MGYEKEVLARARARHAEAVEQHRQAQRLQREEIYRRLPEAEEISRQLRQTMADVMARAFRHGEDPTEAVASIRAKNQALQARRAALLRQAGYAPDALQEGPLCRICGDNGYVGTSRCACLERYCQEEQRRELTSLLGDGASFDSFSLDYYPSAPQAGSQQSPRRQMEFVYEQCVDFAEQFAPGNGRNLLLNGSPGLGKTFLSACIAREVVSRGFSVVYDTAIHVFFCMEKQKFGGGTEEELRTVERVMECDLLILDDLGTEMASPFVTSALYQIVNGRIVSEKSTIISTNLNIGQLGQRYSEQIASRLDSEYRLLPFLGSDIRRIKRQAGR